MSKEKPTKYHSTSKTRCHFERDIENNFSKIIESKMIENQENNIVKRGSTATVKDNNETLRESHIPMKVFVIHENKLGYYTKVAHDLAETIGNDSQFQPIYDLQMWLPQENPSTSEINQKLTEAAKEADLFVRIVPPSSKIGEKRHKGPEIELRKGIYAGKPLLEIFVGGSRSSPNRPPQEINYKNRVAIHLNPGERLDLAFYRGIEEMKEKGII